MSSLLVKKALTTCSLLAGSLLVFVCSMLVKEALAVSSLLFFASSLLVNMVLLGCHLEAVALVLPQFVDRLLPILVGAFRAGASPEKDGPPRAILEAAGRRPVGLREVLVGAIPRCEGDDQHRPGD
jgi:hypothetical protein